PKAKRVYDAQLLGKPLAEPPTTPMVGEGSAEQQAPVIVLPAYAVALDDTAPTLAPTASSPDPLGWMYGPWTGLPGETPVPGRTPTELDVPALEPTVPFVVAAEVEALPAELNGTAVLPPPGAALVIPAPAAPGAAQALSP